MVSGSLPGQSLCAGMGEVRGSCSWEGLVCAGWEVLCMGVPEKEVGYVKGWLRSKGREASRAGPVFRRAVDVFGV